MTRETHRRSHPIVHDRGAWRRRTPRPTGAQRLGAAALLLALPIACGEDDPASPQELLIGTWAATSFEVDGFDFTNIGMTFVVTFDADDTFTLEITNDQVEFCDGAANCTVDGTFTATASQVTISANGDQLTFDYEVGNNEMHWDGQIDETDVEVGLSRQ